MVHPYLRRREQKDCFCDWAPFLSPGERGTIMVLAADRRQARTIYRYAHALLTRVPGSAEHNQVEGVLPWFETGYRFVKRQSQKDPNVWVSLGSPLPAPTTVARQQR